jgi:streptomycin 6-kinase
VSAADDLPAAARLRALAHGEVGARWLRELPTTVRALEEQWGIAVGAAMVDGTAALVAEAVTHDGQPVVLKVAMPAAIDGEGVFARSVLIYALASGRGCAQLLAHDDRREALLLERLGANLDSLGRSSAEQLAIISATLDELWAPVPDGTALPTGAEHAATLAAGIERRWEALGQPCAERTVATALRFAAERAAAFDRSRAVLVHGDAHSWNTLEAGGDAFKFVDPEGLIGERAQDLGIPMRELSDELAAGDAVAIGRARAATLSRMTGVDEEAIWQWGFLERVANGLYSRHLGEHALGTRDLAIADRWALA